LICQGIVVLTLQIATIRSQLGRFHNPQDSARSWHSQLNIFQSHALDQHPSFG
jgi:hypothetical protein